MGFSMRILLALALLLAAVPVVASNVDHYELAPSVMRRNGQPIYPPGAIDPAMANPPGPPPESAIPMPPAPDLPVGTTPMGSPVWSPNGPASPSNSTPGATNAGAWSFPSAAQTQVYPPATAQVYPPATATPAIEKLAQSSWYTRAEYFHWNERIGSVNFVNENGALFTLGYSRQIGIERFRAELFGGDVHYNSYDDTGLKNMASNTGYLGLRGEYEMVLAPAAWEGRFAFLLGLGSRFWIRDLHDGSDNQGYQVVGYQETWWTMYPYLGLETHWRPGSDLDFYSESRVGMTAMTYEFASTTPVVPDPANPFIAERPLWPKVGVFANVEIGLRGPRFFIAGRAEVMSWGESSWGLYSYQPQSLMVTAGGRLGFTF